MNIKIKNIKRDGGTQTRQELNTEIINQYAELMMSEVEFPNIIVFYDGSDYWLSDGFHRVEASIRAGYDEIDADVRQGTRRDAILHSVGANSSHGLRRTNADKRRAVLTLLEDSEWSKWSDREIARRCAVGHVFVNSLRSSLFSVNSEPRTYTTKHGTTATMNTSNIGKKQESNFSRDEQNTILENMEVGDEGLKENENISPVDSNYKNFAEEMACEMYDTILRKHSKLNKDEKNIFMNILMEKLKKLHI